MVYQIYETTHLREKNANKSYHNSKSNNNLRFLRSLEFLQEHLTNEIEASKRHCYFQIKYTPNHTQKLSKA